MPVHVVERQQIVAETAAETWKEDELYALLRRSAPYAALSPEEIRRGVRLLRRWVDQREHLGAVLLTGNGHHLLHDGR